MIKIDNRATGQLRCLGIILERGVNEIPDEVWASLREHPFIAARLEQVVFEVDTGQSEPEPVREQRKGRKTKSKKTEPPEW